MPALVLLDLKMPHVTGLEVLAVKCTRRDMDAIRFVVMSSSNMEKDFEEAKRHGADDYCVKPVSLGELVQIVGSLRRFIPDSPQHRS